MYEQAPGSAAINDIVLDTTHTLFSLRDARERFDVLHVHTPFSTLAAAVETGIPTVHTLHGSFVSEMNACTRSSRDRVWFVAISEAQRRFDPDLRYGGVVYNGIDMDVYSLQEEKEDFVLFLGRGAPEKGWRRAIDAAKLAGERLVSAVKIAHWAEEKEWEENIKPVLPSDFEVLGEISQEEKVDLLAPSEGGAVPDRLAGAVRARDDRGDGLRHARDRHAARIGPRGGRGRGHGLDRRRRGLPGAGRRTPRASREIDPRACRERVQRLFSKEAMVAGYERVFERAIAG